MPGGTGRGAAESSAELIRRLTRAGGVTTRYGTPDYQVDGTTGQPTVYYRFGGRAVAFATETGLRYLLADHLESIHAEVLPNQAEAAQRRYTPFGSDRPVSGASNLTQDERYTEQRRVDAGGGNARRELYHYGARAYLPGVGIFTQPDTIVPDQMNPPWNQRVK